MDRNIKGCNSTGTQTNEQEILHVMSCSQKQADLPIIAFKFGQEKVPAPLDTGVNLSLIQNNVLISRHSYLVNGYYTTRTFLLNWH